MKKISGLLILFIFITSCKKNSTVFLSGTYMGTYNRTGFVNRPNVAVRIIFNGNWFSGDTSNYPKICEGTYQIDGGKIQFHNDCYALVDSLHGLVLSGDYENTLKGDSLIFGRWSSLGIVYQSEVYNLKKQ